MSLPASASRTLAMLSTQDARALLIDLGALAALRSYDRSCAQRFAAELLRQRNSRAQVRDRLIQRFCISERSAYRHIDAAIQSLNPAKTLQAMAGIARNLDTQPTIGVTR